MQKGGNVKNVKMFCALLASNDERTLHLLAPPGDNLRCALRAHSCSPSPTHSLSHSVTHSLISSPFWPCPFGGCQAKCSHKYVNVRYVSVPEMPAATANQAKWLHSQSCRRPRPIPTTSHAPFDVALCATRMCIHQLALTLASEAVKFCIN